MQEKKKITVRKGGWGDYELLRAAIREEQHIHAVNRPDIFADLEDSPFGREDFEKLMEEENSFFLVAEADGRAAGICNVKRSRLRPTRWWCPDAMPTLTISVSLKISGIWVWEKRSMRRWRT